MNPIAIAEFDLINVSNFLRSVAYMVASQQYTRVIWKTDQEAKTKGTVMNALYTIYFWKVPPGTAEIEIDTKAIARKTNELHRHYLKVWLAKVTENPSSGIQYIRNLYKIREDTRTFLQTILRETSDINKGIAQETGKAIRAMVAIKCLCTISLAVGGTFGGAAVATAYGYTKDVAESLGDIKGIAINIGKSFAKDQLKDKAQDAVAKTGRKAATEYMKEQEILEEARQEVQKHQQKMNSAVSRRSLKNAKRNYTAGVEKIVKVKKEIAASHKTFRIARHAYRAIPLVFLAHDVYEALDDLSETWEKSRW